MTAVLLPVLLPVLLGVLIGLVLGGLGGGGAILTVPALVYVLDQSASAATTSSLVIVGFSAATGAVGHVRSGRVEWRLGAAFAAAGVPAAWAGSHLSHAVAASTLLLAFSGLMLFAAVAMVRQPRCADTAEGCATLQARLAARRARRHPRRHPRRHSQGAGAAAASEERPGDGGAVAVLEQPAATTRGASWPAVVVVGLLVGFLTGFFGVGGGFVIVPALVLVLGLPMQRAVGTSLVIVALNSATALASRAGIAQFDWGVIVPFALAAMAATMAGRRVADRLPNRQLRRGFAVLLVGVALYTALDALL